jgi:hypothetical protein
VLKALALLETMSICAKDFLSKKIAQNIWPVIKSKLIQYDTFMLAEEERRKTREKDVKTRYFNESVRFCFCVFNIGIFCFVIIDCFSFAI